MQCSWNVVASAGSGKRQFAFAHVADEGIIESSAASLLRFRRHIGAEGVQVWADVKKKHASHALTADVGIGETAAAVEFMRQRDSIDCRSRLRARVRICRVFASLYTLRDADQKVIKNQVFPSVEAAMCAAMRRMRWILSCAASRCDSTPRS